jgi:hypothetical protein
VKRTFTKAGFRQLVINAALFGVTCVVCLLILEAIVRWLFPYFSPAIQLPFRRLADGTPLGLPSQTVRQATPKGDFDVQVRFNTDGLRDTKNLSQARETDWFVVGDSFTMGWGVGEDERYGNVLERMLKTNGVSANVFNVGIPENLVGYSMLLRYAESRGAKVRRVVFGICMENDLRDYTDGKSASELDSRPQYSSTKQALRAWMQRHSATYMALSFTMQKSAVIRSLLEKVGVARNIEELRGKNEWNETALKTSRDQVVKLVSNRDAIVLIIPARGLWSKATAEVETRVHNAFVDYLREAKIRVVDVKPAFEASGDPLSHYFKTDPHWNPRGHFVAAQELSKVVAAEVQPPNTR